MLHSLSRPYLIILVHIKPEGNGKAKEEYEQYILKQIHTVTSDQKSLATVWTSFILQMLRNTAFVLVEHLM
jgi:hypothetical protein